MKFFYFKAMLLLSMSQLIYAADPQLNSSFKVQAKIENGCSIDNIEQKMDFGQYSALSKDKVVASIINSKSSWNIRCTESLPVSISIDGGENLQNNIRRMRNSSSSNYLPYKLYNSSSLSGEYVIGNKYLLPATIPTNRLANFEIYGVVDLENNNESHAAGIYKDTVSIMITW
ncbi:spore coat U domain-containing protein [Acinetobacter nosocomialis]|uniref:Csu type fimbrial protein n=1 Tax=Acinetobacter nosocomialis TaxID=106654 RepID=UPI0003B2AEE0|nr:spore coat U domain-containing protein [Acinetobacter nosocomialis]MBD0444191.1 spore coat protein U domain-containing protein [Acinetobacter nosocomialis]MBO8208631.1 spore coat protein U domain-containing protein [Acinetobacter nosocomialis]MBO8225082.1 spore coat protein U domain-containing protein [Acinetobacter nosocomialis]MBO8249609.1 spore coat protein U domain-containing protein [Acinetobacter nosocomialis]MDQ9040671.1 spore coat U domain-containing protein [Acinetobacter nosocomia